MKALASWIDSPTETNRPLDLSSAEQDFDREEILDDLSHFTGYAAKGTDVLICTEKGVALLRPHDEHPELLVIVYGLRRQAQLVTFWMNRSSIGTMFSDLIVAHPDRAADFDLLLRQEEEVPA